MAFWQSRANRHGWRNRFLSLSVSLCLLFLCSTKMAAALTEGWKYGESVVYFYSPGCAICKDIEVMVEEIVRNSGLTLLKMDLSQLENINLMYSLLAERGLETGLTGISPSAFTRESHLIGFMESRVLVAMLSGGAVAQSAPRSLSGGTFAAGLIDGVNPCTLNVLLVLLSVCALSDKRRIFSTGFVFVAAVVGAYVCVGLGLGAVLGPIRRWTLVMPLLYLIMGVLLMVFYVRPPKDGFNSVKLTLGRQIRLLRKPGMGYAAVFMVGLISSLFEFVCSGQVYIPVVLYLSTQSRETLIRHLLLYNFAFALPMLIMIGVMAFGYNSVMIQNIVKKPVFESAGRVLMLLLGVYFVIIGVSGLS